MKRTGSMSDTESIYRIVATDVPLSQWGQLDPDALVETEAFAGLDADFRNSKAFRKIIANDTRLVSFRKGDIVIREGDWGNSAFFILSGSVIVDVGRSGQRLPDVLLGRQKNRRKGFFRALAQLWTNHNGAEYRDAETYHDLDGIGRRGSGENTRIFLQDFPAVVDRYRTLELASGQLLGELGALGRTARTATVIANDDVSLLEMRWQGLRDLMRRDTGFRKLIDGRFRDNALSDFLRNSPIFEHLKKDESAMAELFAGAELKSYGEYDRVGSYKQLAARAATSDLRNEHLIAAEGDHPNSVILIRNGLARVSHKHHNGHLTVGYLGPGQVYGLDEIAKGFQTNNPVPLQNSLRAIGFLTTIEIPTPMIERHLLEIAPDPAPTPRRKTQKKKSSGVDTTRLPQDFLEFLVEERIVNGTETMLIDLDRCTRCDDCVRACASAHDNNPRFVRQGPINNNIMVANACMHCQDPVCMIECPTGAISRRPKDGLVVINDVTCIGCSTCANNCPYDAIRMVEVRTADGNFIWDSKTRNPIPKATKCDLCVDQPGGPACQRACPHDALVRIDMRNLPKLTAWQNR